MFTRIKVYRKLRKSDRCLRGWRMIAVLTDDEEMLKMVNEALRLNKEIKKVLWRKNAATEYNLKVESW